MAYSPDDIAYLKKPDGKCFGFIKRIWEKAAEPQELHLIKRTYGAEKLSDGLLLKNAFAVKGVTSVLLYLSLSNPKDFMNDKFFDNFILALKTEGNETNYLLLGRLIRLLQVNKEFGDWILSKGSSAEDNRVWDSLYEISKTQSDDVKKEIIRAIKEGTRQGAAEGQFCIIPEKNLERLKKDIIWKLTDADAQRLEELSKDDNEDLSPQAHLEKLEKENAILKANNIERMAWLEQRTDFERKEKERNQEELARAQARLREILNDANDTVNAGTASTTVNVSELEEVQMDINVLAKQVRSLRIQHVTVQDSVTRLTEEVRSLRESNIAKNREIDDLKRDLHTFITRSLESVSNSLIPIIQGSSASADSSPVQFGNTLSSSNPPY